MQYCKRENSYPMHVPAYFLCSCCKKSQNGTRWSRTRVDNMVRWNQQDVFLGVDCPLDLRQWAACPPFPSPATASHAARIEKGYNERAFRLFCLFCICFRMPSHTTKKAPAKTTGKTISRRSSSSAFDHRTRTSTDLSLLTCLRSISHLQLAH